MAKASSQNVLGSGKTTTRNIRVAPSQKPTVVVFRNQNLQRTQATKQYRLAQNNGNIA